VNATEYVIAGFPNPIGWTIDKVKGFIIGAATEGFEALIGGLVAWVTDAVVWVVGGVFNFFIDSADPNVQADWFLAEDGPYGTMAGIGAALMIGFLLAGVTQGALSGDVGGMLRRMALDLPASVLGMVGLVTATQVLIRLTDELSTAVMGNFQDDIADFTAVVTTLSRLGGGVATAFVVLLPGAGHRACRRDPRGRADGPERPDLHRGRAGATGLRRPALAGAPGRGQEAPLPPGRADPVQVGDGGRAVGRYRRGGRHRLWG
jgi:hypothetical protein